MIGADRQRSGPSCVLLKRVPQGQTESGGLVLAANAGPQVPCGGVTHKRRCTYRHSVFYLIVNKVLSLSLSLARARSLSLGADRRRSGPSCVLLKRVPQGQTESGGIVLAANAGPRVPRSGATRKRRSTYRPSVIYLIVNKLLSLSLSLSPFSLSREAFLALRLLHRCFRRSSGRPTAFVNLFFLSFARSRSYPLRYLFYTIHF